MQSSDVEKCKKADEDSLITQEMNTKDFHVKMLELNDNSSQKADVKIINEKKYPHNVSDTSVIDINISYLNSCTDFEADTKENSEIDRMVLSKLDDNDSLILNDNEELQTEVVTKSTTTAPSSSIPPEKVKNATLSPIENASTTINENEVAVEKDSYYSDKKKSKILWVSNLPETVKATDLKEHLSQVGKVNTVKIVTDGQKYYGYVVMDKCEEANECLKRLNEIYFEGRNIFISFVKPSKQSIDKAGDAPNTSNEKDKITVKDKPVNVDYKADDDVTKKKKRLREHSKRRSVTNPVSGKRDTRKQYSDKRRSLSIERRERERDRRNYLLEKNENERLRCKILRLEQIIKEEAHKKMQKETKYRDLEFQTDKDRKKLKLERELFEKEKREFYKIDQARREIEKEKLKILEMKNKLTEEIRLLKFKHNDEFNLKSKHSNVEREYESKYSCGGKQNSTLKKDLADQKGKQTRSSSSANYKAASNKNYDQTPPPPPKFHVDDSISTNRQSKHDYFDDKKPERAGRKVFVSEKYDDYKNNTVGGKKRLFSVSAPEYSLEGKRFRNVAGYGSHSQQNIQQRLSRTTWNTPDNYNLWKASENINATAVNARYQGTHYYGTSSSSVALGANYRTSPTTTNRAYSSYEQCSHRKY